MRRFVRDGRVQQPMMPRKHCAQQLSECHIERAQRGCIRVAAVVRMLCRVVLERPNRELALRVPERVRERRLLREQQQEYATELQQSAH